MLIINVDFILCLMNFLLHVNGRELLHNGYYRNRHRYHYYNLDDCGHEIKFIEKHDNKSGRNIPHYLCHHKFTIKHKRHGFQQFHRNQFFVRHNLNVIAEERNNTKQPHVIHWPVKREAVVEGDLILGGLMMVHSREDSVTCGPIMPQGGIQALETMLYTLDKINMDNLIPNVTIGAHILDDCDKDTYGLEMAVDFIKGSISNIDEATDYNNCSKGHKKKVISGVVGAASSVTSIQVANLLRLFRIPQVIS